ncbi:anti-sigma F factor [Halobacteroides halobius DSM 5150]|uniref:Anti-sigma F factor n=1 Tax=Halobacteroides halobius (strain ATCC 35273 / DSM 5150 / MD-1) TaxID=748449 RepID=L0K6A8_HALHC|nr:anti-sigma F factor [Halobacteroides halobius]AGB40561.1 anti-sigma F factor [Halobacteroides halobius DSM 5150]
MENKAELVIDGVSDNIGLARVTVASFASQLDFTISELEELKVAISEAVSNSIIHGYGEEEGQVKIKMRVYGGQLEVIIIDQGSGIEDIDTALQPSYTTEGRMGLGLTFIDSFMDQFEIESEVDQGTQLRMIKIPTREQQQVN